MRYFMSDPHFATPGIIPNMGRVHPRTGKLFTSAEEHDTYIIDLINETVMRTDELFCLGDWSKEKPGKYRQRINCKHIKLILGNHDSRAKCENVFGICPSILTTKLRCPLGTLTCVLSHFPIAYWDRSHLNWSHLYGHTHGQRETTLDRAFPGRRSRDITLDNIYNLSGDYRPMSEVNLYRYFIACRGHDDTTHYDALKAARDAEREV